MRQPYELSIAARYLRTSSGQSFISFISVVSMVGIGLAVAVLIVVLSVMNGFEHELQQRILGMVSDATIGGYEGPLDDWRAMRARVLEQPDIRAAAPYVEGQALAVAGERLGGVTVRGVEPELEREVSSIGAITREGDIGALVGGGYKIVIGKSLADALDVGIGGQVVLVLAVAAFNIVSPLMMVVRDKRGDIAILRSFGTTPGSVVAIFASQGTLIGLVGTLLGIALALLVSWQLGNIVELLQTSLGINL